MAIMNVYLWFLIGLGMIFLMRWFYMTKIKMPVTVNFFALLFASQMIETFGYALIKVHTLRALGICLPPILLSIAAGVFFARTLVKMVPPPTPREGEGSDGK